MPYPRLDYTKLNVLPLAERQSFIDIEKEAIDPDAPRSSCDLPAEPLARLVRRITLPATALVLL